jgi:hypothetical protein
MSDRMITRRRVARKRHVCDNDYAHAGWVIYPGSVYLEHTSFPGHDSGYATQAGHPVRLKECAECAERRML